MSKAYYGEDIMPDHRKDDLAAEPYKPLPAKYPREYVESLDVSDDEKQRMLRETENDT